MVPRSVISVAAPALRQAARRPAPAAARLLSPSRTVRWNSSSSEPSAYSSFFKTFGRPIAKVSLMAVFAYQLVFFAWMKLETDDIRSSRNAEIASLETQVKELQAAKKA
ncbi:hypothetical protein F503_07507 [Ophiostoma piceae UAMH 11346]|uniref:Inner membrane assembly complex subunit 17 n=1 Tax=Ophiostoma piceae (strain UAMH 11346) TaxID=1262450 RepID=S3CCM8_OPHP1|nr:hypothetical protein F503_07507 [Ophiostoma piceae UAMH 11346]